MIRILRRKTQASQASQVAGVASVERRNCQGGRNVHPWESRGRRGEGLRRLWLLVVPSLFVLAAGCASAGPAIERLTPDDLLDRGIHEYEARRFNEAIRVLERMTLNYPGHGRSQEARFYLGSAYLGRREYLSAASEFTRLANDFPFGPYAARARFGVCDAYYRLSPRVELDQSYTSAGVDHCRALVSYYPDSEDVGRAREMAQELEHKLADKQFRTGEDYFRRRLFDSAIIYYEEVVQQFPAAPAAPRALLKMVEAYSKIGYVEEAESARDRLLREYPSSTEASVAREISIAGGS
jgi:outer membrane protein assembly factor BamD